MNAAGPGNALSGDALLVEAHGATTRNALMGGLAAAEDRGGAAAPAPRAPRSPSRPRPECGHFDIRIARDGTWHYRGSPIGRKELVCLFASVLHREPDGSYVLETPVERGTIEVEDAPFVAVELCWCEGRGHEGRGRQTIGFRTTLDECVTADAEHPIRVDIDPVTGEPRPYVMVRPGRDGAPGLEARLNRPVFYELVALAVPETVDGREVLGVWSEGVFFPIDDVPADFGGEADA
ncbi:DUF1285 domain-containing protein [Roseomonas sp. NAR14]|uniref:DUF1285 domain-containing protein n=1 Tax=Roseomonas acroporae TaxID=2937791 RepID=A0A9X1YF38_9PROT|nr:DUF1285 domain-containing protein [Roseomonas acroporae]MCK8787808.1 DUF1285 domain-containing protein [Roseomonas acroporae]